MAVLPLPFGIFFQSCGIFVCFCRQFCLFLLIVSTTIQSNLETVEVFLLFTCKLHALVLHDAAHDRAKRVSDSLLEFVKLILDGLESLEDPILRQDVI